MMHNLYGYNVGIGSTDLPKVKGIESARQFPTQPNSRVAIFDEDDDIFYVIATDASNFKTIRRFRFAEEPIEVAYDNKYVTKEEFNSLKEAIDNVQQLIQQQYTPVG